MNRIPVGLLAATILVLGTTAVASAQPDVPTPGTEDVGLSQNDVREEPSTPKDLNGFKEAPSGDSFWSPRGGVLVFDAFVAYGEATGEDFIVSEDVSNIRNRVQHGDNYDAHERRMYPGPNTFGAWWGRWSDTGGGGDLQGSDATSGVAFVGQSNGAIDDANDCDDVQWDEFTWRGAWRGENNPKCGIVVPGGDTILAFVQPGTHNLHVNSLPIPTLGPTVPPSLIHNDTDSSQVADFSYHCEMGASAQACTGPNGFARYQYDQSLLITTQVLAAVNPLETKETIRGHTAYQPFTASPKADTYMRDQDFYTAASGRLEDAYRMTVWDPPQDYGDDEDEENLLARIHPGGPKEYAKEDGSHLLVSTPGRVRTTGGEAVDPVEPQAGLAYDLLLGPRPHEPNHPDDEYGLADTDDDGVLETATWATFDADTTYNPRTDSDDDGEAEYYEPGTEQNYKVYRDEEHTWMDTTTSMDVCPIWARLNCYHEWAHLGPSVPSPSDPAADASSKGEHQSTAPGLLYVHGNLGTWYDDDEDTWVGNAGAGTVRAPGKHGPGIVATQEGEPYANGLIQNPNQYDTQRFSHGEWRPLCTGTWNVTLRSNYNPDGDAYGEWGTTGVYVFPTSDDGVPYSDMYMDVAGDTAQPVGDTIRQNGLPVGDASLVVPDDENGRLSRYRTEGPISITMDNPKGSCDRWGSWDPVERVLFPTGTPGYSFTVIAEATNTAENRVSQHGGNIGSSLTGETIRDVDVVHANQEMVDGQPVFADHPIHGS